MRDGCRLAVLRGQGGHCHNFKNAEILFSINLGNRVYKCSVKVIFLDLRKWCFLSLILNVKFRKYIMPKNA